MRSNCNATMYSRDADLMRKLGAVPAEDDISLAHGPHIAINTLVRVNCGVFTIGGLGRLIWPLIPGAEKPLPGIRRC